MTIKKKKKKKIWGPRHPVVVSKAWNRADVKVELMKAEAAKGVVVRGMVCCGMKQTVHMAVGSGGASMTRRAQGTDNGWMSPEMVAGLHPREVGMAVPRPVVGACFWCRKTGHWKNKCPCGGGVDVLECFTYGWRGHIRKDCARQVRLDMQAIVGIKDKRRRWQEPEVSRMGPNARG